MVAFGRKSNSLTLILARETVNSQNRGQPGGSLTKRKVNLIMFLPNPIQKKHSKLIKELNGGTDTLNLRNIRAE